MLALGAQPGRARALGQRRWGRRELAAAAPVAALTVAALTVGAVWLLWARSALATAATGTFGAPFVTAFVATAGLVRRHLGDGLKGDARAGDFEQGDVALALLDDRYRRDSGAVEIHLNLGSQYVANFAVGRKQLAGPDTFRGFRTSLTPSE